jgi:hypothetical protein
LIFGPRGVTAGEHAIEHWPDHIPDFGPDLLAWAAERPWMFLAEDFGIGIVVKDYEVGSPVINDGKA